jgi:tRNA(Ile)-lysidine synthetase-like protein
MVYLDRAATGPTLTVRAWRPGDRVRPLGLGGTRKVQDVFVDRKVPRALRGRIPIVEGPRGIAWIAGLCVSEAYRAGQGAAAVRLTWRPVEP